MGGATNYVSVVNNSFTNIVNDVAMSCQSESTNINNLDYYGTFSNISNSNIIVRFEQNISSNVASACVNNSEVYNTASTSILNEIEQIAKAEQEGGIKPPSVKNTTQIMNDVNHTIMNTYNSTCAQSVTNSNVGVFRVENDNLQNVNYDFSVKQEIQNDVIFDCLNKNITDSGSYTDMTNDVKQTAETSSTSILKYIIRLIIVITAVLLIFAFFGKKIGEGISQMFIQIASGGKSFLWTILYIAVGIFMISGTIIGIMALYYWILWMGDSGPWATGREEEPYTPYDGVYNEVTDTFDCGAFDPVITFKSFRGSPNWEGTGKQAVGFKNCVSDKFELGLSKPIMSYWCKNDLDFYKNFRIDFDYFIPPMITTNEIHAEYKKRWTRLPPILFDNVKTQDWPVTINMNRTGNWPVESDGIQFYNVQWQNIKAPENEEGMTFREKFPNAEALFTAMRNYPMGVCSANDNYTNSTTFNYLPMIKPSAVDQLELKLFDGGSYDENCNRDPDSGFMKCDNFDKRTSLTYTWDILYVAFGTYAAQRALNFLITTVMFLLHPQLSQTNIKMIGLRFFLIVI
jgi:hypothetical protein